MWLVWNYIRCIHSSRSTILTQTNLVWWNAGINMRLNVVMRIGWHALMRVCFHAWIRIIIIVLVDIFIM